MLHPDGKMNLLAQVRKTILLFRTLLVSVRKRRKPKAAEETDQPESIDLRVKCPQNVLVSFWDTELFSKFLGIVVVVSWPSGPNLQVY